MREECDEIKFLGLCLWSLMLGYKKVVCKLFFVIYIDNFYLGIF